MLRTWNTVSLDNFIIDLSYGISCTSIIYFRLRIDIAEHIFVDIIKFLYRQYFAAVDYVLVDCAAEISMVWADRTVWGWRVSLR